MPRSLVTHLVCLLLPLVVGCQSAVDQAIVIVESIGGEVRQHEAFDGTQSWEVSFEGCHVQPPQVAALGNLEPLVQLNLRQAHLTPAAFEQLRTLAHLERLDLYGSNVADPQLVELKSLNSLTWLSVANTAVTDRGLEAIARIPQLTHLAAPPATTDLGVRHLADLPELRTLSLIDTQVSGSTLSVFAAHPLEVLWLQNTPLTSDGVQQVGDLHQLRRLSVANTQITDDDFHALATLLELDYLDISETSVGDAGILHLLPLPRLYVIDAYQTQITPAAVHSFQQQHPDIQFCTGIRSGTENSPPRASASPPGHPRKPAKVVDPGV